MRLVSAPQRGAAYQSVVKLQDWESAIVSAPPTGHNIPPRSEIPRLRNAPCFCAPTGRRIPAQGETLGRGIHNSGVLKERRILLNYGLSPRTIPVQVSSRADVACRFLKAGLHGRSSGTSAGPCGSGECGWGGGSTLNLEFPNFIQENMNHCS
jgi:hypothetical protein